MGRRPKAEDAAENSAPDQGLPPDAEVPSGPTKALKDTEDTAANAPEATTEAPVEAEAPASTSGGLASIASTSGSGEDTTEAMGLNAAMLLEEEEARAEREAQEKIAAAAAPAAPLTKDKVDHLDQLLKQAAIYSQFLTEQTQAVQDEMEPLEEEADPAAEAAGGKRKRTGKAGAKSKKVKAEVKSPTQQQLPLIKGDLRGYQLKGVRWMISLWHNGMNGILADQMGLGKTVQTVGFLSHLVQNGVKGPFLVLAPLSTLSNWDREVERWCPSMKSLLYHGSKEERAALRAKHFSRYDRRTESVPDDFPVIITSFEICIRDRKLLQPMRYKYLVVDEGHRLKNSACLLVRELNQLKVDNKLLLTGTPLQNNLAELWSLLHFLKPDIFNSLDQFESWFDFSNVVGSDDRENVSKEILANEAKNRMVSKLHEILKPFLLRRIKADVETSLPSKSEIILYAALTPAQRKLQSQLVDKTLLADIQEQLLKERGGNVPVKALNNMMMQLRKNCNHPDLITCDWEQSPMYPTADELVEQCGKMQLLERLLKKLQPAGHKVLIFSQFTRMLDLLDSYFDERGISVKRIDGNVGYKERMAAMDEFNSNPECFIFLLSTRAGGLGINLTSADTVVIYDSDWNPHQDMQAMDRAHRIGQTRPVLVLRLCTADSVEVKLLKRANSKLALTRLVIKSGAFQGGDTVEDKASLTAQELLSVLQGDMRLDGTSQANVADEKTLDMILDRTHLAKKIACPYPDTGLGYEIVKQEEAGLLASVL